jgi:selenocysteine lyase/cysteine desulfurase
MIYLDNAATSFPKAPGVAEAVAASIATLPGSAGRSSHAWAVEAGELLYDARLEAAAFLGLPDPGRLAFTKSATEAINIVLSGLLGPGDRVVSSGLEHNAVMRPLRSLEASMGIVVEIAPSSASGLPDLDALECLLSPRATGKRPALLAFAAASNVSGGILPIGCIASLAERYAIPLLVDASQLAGHRSLAPRPFASWPKAARGISYLAFSGHKGLLGPAGTGGLWISPDARLPRPLILGGTGSRSESELQPDFLPDIYEAGTHNLAALAGLRASIAWLSGLAPNELEAREGRLTRRLAEGLASLPGLRLLGPGPDAERLPLVSCVSDSLPEDEMARELDRRGIAIRYGLHCAPAAHRSLGSFERGGALRFSPGPFTTDGELDACLSALEEILHG